MRTHRLLALAVVGFLSGATVWAQVPVGGQGTFGRTTNAPGRPFPFLNGHGYSTTTDSGRPQPFLNGHGYSTTTDPGLGFSFLNGHAYGNSTPTTFATAPRSAPVSGATRPSIFPSPVFQPTVPLILNGTGGTFLTPLPAQAFQPSFMGFSGVQPSIPMTISTVNPGFFVTPGR
jgi:hypothetical protein